MGQKDDENDMNISLPEAQKKHVEERVSAGRYRSPSEYIADLIRRDQRESARADLEKELIEGQESGPAAPFDDDFFERQRERIRRASSGESKTS